MRGLDRSPARDTDDQPRARHPGEPGVQPRRSNACGGLPRPNSVVGRTHASALRAPLVARTSPAFSPDGRTFASADLDGRIWLRDARTGKPVGAPYMGRSRTVLGIAFSGDAAMLASASADKTIRLWDLHSRTHRGTPLRGHSHSVYSVAFSGDGRTLAAGSADGTISLWDTRTRAPVGQPLVGHDGAAVRSVVFNHDGHTLASSGLDRTAQLWDVRARKRLGTPLRSRTSLAFIQTGARS